MAGNKATQLTLKKMRAEGYLTSIVEKYNSFAHIRIDMYGLIDIVGIRRDLPGVLGVNSTTGDHVPDHIVKAQANETLPVWLEAGNRFEIWGWRKMGAFGKRKLWEVRRVQAVVINGRVIFHEPGKELGGGKRCVTSTI